MRDCLLKTMGTTISMMNLHLFFLSETYTGVLFNEFVEGGISFLSHLDNQLSGASWHNASVCGYFTGRHGRGVPLGCCFGDSS